MKKKSLCPYLVLIAMVLAACTKPDEPQPQRTGVYPPHPMAGSEIQFDSLGWQFEDNNDNIFIYIGYRPDLFMPFWKLDISLRLDTSQVWIPVNFSNGFAYNVSPGHLYIFPSPADTTLAGRQASVKTKFQ
jgi:hypothetical protein